MKFFLASRFTRGILRLSPRTKRYTDTMKAEIIRTKVDPSKGFGEYLYTGKVYNESGIAFFTKTATSLEYLKSSLKSAAKMYSKGGWDIAIVNNCRAGNI